MRISTSEIFGNGINAIQRQQAQLTRTQEQLATGRRVLRPSEDPGAAVQALKLRERVAAVEQYTRNATLATSRLEGQETVLSQMGDALQRARELSVQAANATQTSESRAAIAREIRQLGDQLLDSANSRDASGEYLFAGFRSGNRPFVRDPSGRVEYLGDGGQRRVALSPDRSVAVGDSGLEWMSIPRGNGVYAVTPAPGNVGTARVNTAEITNPADVAPVSYTLEFTAPDTWALRGAAGDLLATGSYAPGQAIDVGGRRIVLDGTPAAGDRFEIAPAGVTSLFSIFDDLAAALEAPVNTPGAPARRDHAINVALGDIDQGIARVLELRTSVGARLNTIESQGVINEDQGLALKTALSAIEDLDYADAISRFNLQQVALQAAQQTYVQLGRLSLFDFIR